MDHTKIQNVKLKDLEFEPYLTHDEIQDIVRQVAYKINEDYAGKEPLFLAVLNGVFMFSSDLMKELCLNCRISFVKVSSYEGTQSTGMVKELIGIGEDLKGKDVILLEDIVDTGNTMAQILPGLLEKEPASLEIATLLLKPAALQHDLDLKYVGKEIPNDFIVGYGLDYDGLGRNLRAIYKKV